MPATGLPRHHPQFPAGVLVRRHGLAHLLPERLDQVVDGRSGRAGGLRETLEEVQVTLQPARPGPVNARELLVGVRGLDPCGVLDRVGPQTGRSPGLGRGPVQLQRSPVIELREWRRRLLQLDQAGLDRVPELGETTPGGGGLL